MRAKLNIKRASVGFFRLGLQCNGPFLKGLFGIFEHDKDFVKKNLLAGFVWVLDSKESKKKKE